EKLDLQIALGVRPLGRDLRGALEVGQLLLPLLFLALLVAAEDAGDAADDRGAGGNEGIARHHAELESLSGAGERRASLAAYHLPDHVDAHGDGVGLALGAVGL